MAEAKKLPLFIADVGMIADGDIDEWAIRMAEYVSRVTGLPLEEDPSVPDEGSPSDKPDAS